jgi:hypothetical protein
MTCIPTPQEWLAIVASEQVVRIEPIVALLVRRMNRKMIGFVSNNDPVRTADFKITVDKTKHSIRQEDVGLIKSQFASKGWVVEYERGRGSYIFSFSTNKKK